MGASTRAKRRWWDGSTLQAYIFEALLLCKPGTHWSYGIPTPFTHEVQVFFFRRPTLLYLLSVLTMIVEGFAPLMLFVPARFGSPFSSLSVCRCTTLSLTSRTLTLCLGGDPFMPFSSWIRLLRLGRIPTSMGHWGLQRLHSRPPQYCRHCLWHLFWRSQLPVSRCNLFPSWRCCLFPVSACSMCCEICLTLLPRNLFGCLRSHMPPARSTITLSAHATGFLTLALMSMHSCLSDICR